MKRTSLAVILFLGAQSAFSEGPRSPTDIPKDAVPIPAALFNFDRDALRQPPQRFILAVAQEGPEAHWEVTQDPHAPSAPNVLMQSGRVRPGENFALALLDGVQLEHGEAAVKFKPISGEEAQSAGLVWRYQDSQNFYVALANAKDDTCAVYRVKKGKSKLLDSQAVIVSPLTWHELRAVFVGENYAILVDGELTVGGKDSGLKKAGLAGMATQSDSVIAFDDFRLAK